MTWLDLLLVSVQLGPWEGSSYIGLSFGYVGGENEGWAGVQHPGVLVPAAPMSTDLPQLPMSRAGIGPAAAFSNPSGAWG